LWFDLETLNLLEKCAAAWNGYANAENNPGSVRRHHHGTLTRRDFDSFQEHSTSVSDVISDYFFQDKQC
jgi:hypothetical protein